MAEPPDQPPSGGGQAPPIPQPDDKPKKGKDKDEK